MKTMTVTHDMAYTACKIHRLTRDEPSPGEIARMQVKLQWFANAHLAPREVSDEDVERASKAFFENYYVDSDWLKIHPSQFAQLHKAMRAAIQADRQRGGGVVPSERFYAPLPSDADEYDRGHVDGWNACRQALLDQRGQVREGWKLVPVEPNEDMFDAVEPLTRQEELDLRAIYKAMLAAAPDAVEVKS